MSTSVFLNFIKLLKNREQIDNKIKILPYNAYYLAAKCIGGNYRFNKDGNIYYEDVVIDCNSLLGVVIRDKFIIQTTDDKIFTACLEIYRINYIFSADGRYDNIRHFFVVYITSNVFDLHMCICYLCGRMSYWMTDRTMHGNEKVWCKSRRCINRCKNVCNYCFAKFYYNYNIYSEPNDFDCVCDGKYIDQELEQHFNLEKLIRNIITLG